MRLPSLRRITSSNQYNPAIDGVRFLAIALVLSQHVFERVSRRSVDVYGDFANAPSSRYFFTGAMGVAIFFALSGYVLFSGLLRSLEREGRLTGPTVKRYFLRRVSRIEPPYLIALTLVFLFLKATHYVGNQAGKGSLVDSYFASLAYLHNLIFGSQSRILPVAWSLEIEVQFYILAPLFALLIVALRRRSKGAGAAALAGAVLLWCAVPASWLTLMTLVSVFPSFLAGMLLAECEAALPRLLPRAYFADGLTILGLALLFCRLLGTLPNGAWNMFVDGFAALCILLGPLRGRILMRLASLGPIATIGGMCYSIYLMHLPILEVAAAATHRLGLGSPLPVYLTLQFALLLTTALVGSTIYFVLVERPCMDPSWPQRLWARLRPKRAR